MPLTQKPIDSPFGARTEAAEVVKHKDLTGKTAIVTGATSGVGVEIVRALAGAGARVVIPVRSLDKGLALAKEMRASSGKGAIEVRHMDLADLESVRSFADAFVQSGAALDILINNAGILAIERRMVAGCESHFAVNHLGHMLLSCRLLPALRRSSAARVVALTSLGHRRSPIIFDDLNFEQRPYDKWEAYGQSKTANSLFAVAMNRRTEPRGVTVYAAHPGGIMTALQRELTQSELVAMGWIDEQGRVNPRFKSTAGGAATPVWCASSSLLGAGGGVYCENCNVAEAVEPSYAGTNGVRPWAIDADDAERLWSLSESMLGETLL